MSKRFEIVTGRFGASQRMSRWCRVVIVLVTLAVVQAALLGTSLTGESVMLPLKLLRVQNPPFLLPATAEDPEPKASLTGLDPVVQFEPFRKFVVEEYRSGRVPLWNRYSYCGSPFMANAQSGVMSPYRAVDVAFNDPMSTAWVQMFKALVAGLGMYLFLRIALKVRFLPALAGAHLFPLCGFMLFWCGHPHTQVATWLPWVMLGCDRLVRRPGPGWLALASGSAAACFYSGHPQTTTHVYLCAGVWSAGLLLHAAWRKPVKVSVTRAGWIVAAGVFTALLVGPQLLTTAEYLPWSLRLENRAAGKAVIPVSGLAGLMDMAVPYFNGSLLHKTKFFGPFNHAESMAAGSVGLVWALFFMPLGLWLGRRDWRVWLLGVLFVVGVGKAAGLPGLSVIYDHGPLAMLSPSRLVFIGGVAVIVLGAVGFDRLTRGRRLGWLGAGLCALPAVAGLVALGYGMVWARGMGVNPEATEKMVEAGKWFVPAYAFAGVMVVGLVVGLVIVVRMPRAGGRVAVALGGLAVAEMIGLAWGMYPSAPRSEFYPRIPALEWVAEKTGIEYRVCGVVCFPANLNLEYGIADPRGYDALDPRPMVELLEKFRETRVARMDPDFALVMGWTPNVHSPLLRMLAVKYVILRGRPSARAKPVFVGDDYWVMEISGAPSRVYVPETVVVEADAATRVAGLTSPAFDPLKVVVAEKGMMGIKPGAAVAGMAEIVEDTGGRIKAKAVMGTAGVMVLADMWYPGWEATVDGKSAEVMRVNHTLKGVALAAGEHEVVFEYKPAGFKIGLWMLFVGVVGLCGVWGVSGKKKGSF
jgi:hypothetical protein